jgi:hypothetical protein
MAVSPTVAAGRIAVAALPLAPTGVDVAAALLDVALARLPGRADAAPAVELAELAGATVAPALADAADAVAVVAPFAVTGFVRAGPPGTADSGTGADSGTSADAVADVAAGPPGSGEDPASEASSRFEAGQLTGSPNWVAARRAALTVSLELGSRRR